MLCYEQPLNERIRTFLRIEHLTSRFHYHRLDTSFWGRRAAMGALLDILNVLSRHDIRAQVSKELTQRRSALANLEGDESIDHEALERVLSEIDGISHDLAHIPPQFASYQLRDNALLNSLDSRHAIPGSSCSFDLPGYHHWLSQPNERIDADLNQWMRRVLPIENGIRLLLRLLRDSTTATEVLAQNGVLVHNTETGTQMIRAMLDDASLFPEISGNRHRATIRFMQYQDSQLHVRQTENNVTFRMACCRY